MGEGRVVGLDPDPRQDRRGAHAGVGVLDRRLEQVAELPLGHRDERVERERGNLLAGARVLDVQGSDLGAVAVREHELVA